MTYKMITCSCCGKKRRDYNVTEINGKKVCLNCKRRYYRRNAFNNEEWVRYVNPKTYSYEPEEGYAFFCGNYDTKQIARISELEDRGYKKCPKCGKYQIEEKLITINNEKICIRCKPQNYERCSWCGKYHEISTMKYTREGYVCKNCLEEKYIQCSSCGKYVLAGNLYSRNGKVYCSDCIKSLVNATIHCYHDNNVIYNKLYTADDDINDTKTCYFGFELEVSGDRNLCLNFMDIENIDREVVLMKDSSIKNGGFEIVTMPMTKNYINEVFIPKFSKALKFLRDNDFKGHNYGGLHIHISQDAVTNKQMSQLSEILYGNERDKKIWLGITQRKASEMNNWSKMTNRLGDFYSVNTIPDSAGKAAIGSPRYTALCKDDRTRTYEFRIFNSNIRIERFLKNYECVLALLDYTKLNENNPLPICNTVGFIDYVYANENKYKYLYEFFVERQIKEHYRYGYIDSEVERCA